MFFINISAGRGGGFECFRVVGGVEVSDELIKLVENHPRVKVNKIKVACMIVGTFTDEIRGEFNVFEIEEDNLGRNRLIYTHDDVVELHNIESLRLALLEGKIPRHYRTCYVRRS